MKVMKRRVRRIEGLVGTDEKGGERLDPAIKARVQSIVGSREPDDRPEGDLIGKNGIAFRESTEKLPPALEALVRQITEHD